MKRRTPIHETGAMAPKPTGISLKGGLNPVVDTFTGIAHQIGVDWRCERL